MSSSRIRSSANRGIVLIAFIGFFIISIASIANSRPQHHKTTVDDVEVTCAVCSEKSTQMVMMSTNSSGYSDLDLRPPEMRRSTIIWWVQRCPYCGHCASDIESAEEDTKEIVESAEYQAQLESADFPELANSFLCEAMIEEHLGSMTDAGWDCVHAAWVCDDAENEKATWCRLKAVEHFEQGIEAGESVMEDAPDGANELLLAELLRRAGEFDCAKAKVEAGLEFGFEPDNEIIKTILEFELELMGKGDTACHSMSEVVTDEESVE